jgi:hypothetical protein
MTTARGGGGVTLGLVGLVGLVGLLASSNETIKLDTNLTIHSHLGFSCYGMYIIKSNLGLYCHGEE